MRKVLLAFIVLLMGGVCFGQTEKIKVFTDLDIASNLIAKDSLEFERVLQTYDIEYWITERNKDGLVLYLSYNNSVRLWEVNTSNIWREIGGVNRLVAENIVTEIFVRYRHSNLNDLKHLYLYEKPQNTETREYEKQFGKRLSHFRIKQN